MEWPRSKQRLHGCSPRLRVESASRRQFVTVQSLPETVQVLRPPGTWAVPGAFFFRAAIKLGLSLKAPPPGAERLLRWIMGGIVVWGAFHALGAWTLNHDARRPLIVLACVGAFLGFWLLMLSTLRRTEK